MSRGKSPLAEGWGNQALRRILRKIATSLPDLAVITSPLKIAEMNCISKLATWINGVSGKRVEKEQEKVMGSDHSICLKVSSC
jgi:hypothetical protein